VFLKQNLLIGLQFSNQEEAQEFCQMVLSIMPKDQPGMVLPSGSGSFSEYFEAKVLLVFTHTHESSRSV